MKELEYEGLMNKAEYEALLERDRTEDLGAVVARRRAEIARNMATLAELAEKAKRSQGDP